jgi:hypothetical protein
LGAVVSKWLNATKVRPAGDSGGTHYTADPFPRTDPISCGTTPTDIGSPAGSCGSWIFGGIGDANGLSAQEIDAAVDDIMACAADDSTHAKSDHNCYVKSATDTVDMRLNKLFGGDWKFAKKFWHGCFGWLSKDAPGITPDPDSGADGTKYLTIANTATIIRSTWTYEMDGVTQRPQGKITDTLAGSRSVNRNSGIITLSSDYLVKQEWLDYFSMGTPTDPATYLIIENGNGTTDWGATPVVHGSTDADSTVTANPYAYVSGGPAEVPDVDSAISDYNSKVTAMNAYDSGSRAIFTKPTTPGGFTFSGSESTAIDSVSLDITVTRSNTSYEWNVSYSYAQPGYQGNSLSSIGTKVLSDAYSGSGLLDDLNNAFDAWDMSDASLFGLVSGSASLRQDGKLALGALCCFDEVGSPVSPLGYDIDTMDDYSGSYGSPIVGYWPQRAWLDPNSFCWKTPGGQYFTGSGSAVDGSSIATGLRTGDIIAHNVAGSDPHFWFGFRSFQRQACSGGGGYQWVNYENGGFANSLLPSATKRWMDDFEAQYDADLCGPGATYPPGNYPQFFINQYNGKAIAGKYIQATQRWNAINYGRPCGEDKFAIDQTTVCSISSGNAASGFVVTNTSHATLPLSAGGLAVNDYIAVESGADAGIYKINAITGTGPWTISVSSLGLLDTLPTGFAFCPSTIYGSGIRADGTVHIGRLRFPRATGTCGKVPCTTVLAAGILTITVASQPWLRIDPTTGTITLNLYDAGGTLIEAVTATRVSDTSFTCTPATATSASFIWQVGYKLISSSWTLQTPDDYANASQRTGVHLTWTFDARAPYSSSPPTPYAVTGCESCAIEQFNYDLGQCRAVVGIVPFSGGTPAPVESFPTQTLFSFPSSVTFDEAYGAHAQGAVMLTMVDPFYQAPYKPDGDSLSFQWLEDDGSGTADDIGASQYYYAHRPLVEAAASLPSGKTLPDGVNLTYDGTSDIAPPFYPNGIPQASGYADVETDWGFTLKALAATRFSEAYLTFVYVP